MVRYSCGEDLEATLNFPVSTINWDAIKQRVAQGRKYQFEYVWQSVGLYLSLVLICFG